MSDLDNLKRQLSYTFLDAYGNFDGADILFDSIVKATEQRIIKLLVEQAQFALDNGDALRSDADMRGYQLAVKHSLQLIKGENK